MLRSLIFRSILAIAAAIIFALIVMAGTLVRAQAPPASPTAQARPSPYQPDINKVLKTLQDELSQKSLENAVLKSVNENLQAEIERLTKELAAKSGAKPEPNLDSKPTGGK